MNNVNAYGMRSIEIKIGTMKFKTKFGLILKIGWVIVCKAVNQFSQDNIEIELKMN